MERGISQEEEAALGHTWQALTEGKGLPEQDGCESQVARLEIPQPSPELGFTAAVMETAPPGSVGAWGMTVLRKASWCSAGGREQGTPRLGGWLDRPPPTPTAPCPRHPPLLPGGDIQEKRHLAEGKLRHGGVCLSPLQRRSAKWGLGSSGIPGHSLSRDFKGWQLPAGHCLHSAFGEPAPPPPDGDLPTGARTSRLLPAHPGQVASGVHSCGPPFISFQAGARFPSPAALQAGGQESCRQG